MKRRSHPTRHGCSGFALISGLLILVVITILALSMFRSVGMQEKIAGNTREKQRSFEAAQTSLQYAETWLGHGNWSQGATCSGVTAATTGMRVCSNPISNPTNTSPTSLWPVRSDFTPKSMTVDDGGGLNSDLDINYQASPALHVGYMGMTPFSDGLLFQLSAVGYGGSASTVTVVQSVYQVTKPKITSTDGP